MEQFSVSLGTAIKRYWTDNWTVKGRASRSEMWKGTLGNLILVSIAVYAIAYLMATLQLLILLTIFLVALSLALNWIGMNLSMRRLHDIGKSGWWYWIGLVPPVGAIILLVWACTASEATENQYGPVPNVK